MKKLVSLMIVVCTLFAVTGCAGINSAPNDTNIPSRKDELVEIPNIAPPTTLPAETEPEEVIPTHIPTEYVEAYQILINDFARVIKHNKKGLEGDPELSTLLTLAKETVSKDFWTVMVGELFFDGLDQDSYGYILNDLDRDGTPELFWVKNNHDILGVFSFKNESVVVLDFLGSGYSGYVSKDNVYYIWIENKCVVKTLRNDAPVYAFRFGYTEELGYYASTETYSIDISASRLAELKEQFPEENSNFWKAKKVLALDVPVVGTYEENSGDVLPFMWTVPSESGELYKGPGEDWYCMDYMEPGTFTIMVVVEDEDGDEWGLLKSGAGWIRLRQPVAVEVRQPVLSGNFANEMLVNQDYCYHYMLDDTEYSQRMVLRVDAWATNVSFYSMKVSESWEVDQELFYMASWNPEKYLVVDASFPGDMTMYGIRFTDSQGNSYFYTISISGRDGSLVLTKL